MKSLIWNFTVILNIHRFFSKSTGIFIGFFQNPQGELFKIWKAYCVDSDLWQLNLYHKHRRDTNSWMNIHVFYQNPQGEIFKVWMVFIFHDNDVWQLKWCMTVESLSHTQRGYWFYSLMIFICFIKIHKVNSSKYEWSLDLLTVIIDSWIFTTNTEWTKTCQPYHLVP